MRNLNKTEARLKKVSGKLAGSRTRPKKPKLRASHLLPVEVFSEKFSWPTKIAYVLWKLKAATAEQVAAEINELQGTASQEEVADVQITVSEFLNKLFRSGKIKAKPQPGGESHFSLISKYHLK